MKICAVRPSKVCAIRGNLLEIHLWPRDTIDSKVSGRGDSNHFVGANDTVRPLAGPRNDLLRGGAVGPQLARHSEPEGLLGGAAILRVHDCECPLVLCKYWSGSRLGECSACAGYEFGQIFRRQMLRLRIGYGYLVSGELHWREFARILISMRFVLRDGSVSRAGAASDFRQAASWEDSEPLIQREHHTWQQVLTGRLPRR